MLTYYLKHAALFKSPRALAHGLTLVSPQPANRQMFA
jgi:hypothetical protein